ncbi:hypothetical protein BH10PLA2_BH10PLA2_25920 [soil metagenome]
MSDAAAVLSGWERTARAVERVKARLRRAAAALSGAGIPYAVIGGNAIAEWVGRVDDAAVRNTQDIDILVRRADLEATKSALETVGFVHSYLIGLDIFLDGANANPRDAIHVVFEREKIRSGDILPTPDISESEPAPQFQVVSLPALVRMKLDSNRLKDRVHILDLIGVGLVDASWLSQLPPLLAERLKLLLENPDS